MRLPSASAETKASLPRQAMVDVLVELQRRVVHHGPVPGRDQFELARAQAPQRVQILPQLPHHEHAALAEHRIAGEGNPVRDERDVVGCVPRSPDHLERPVAVTVPE